MPQTQAVTVPVEPAPNAQRLKCFYNVRDACAKSSGDIAFGWALWMWPSVNIEAIHHAVWRQPNGTLVDITPPELTVPGITFIEDAGVAFDLDDILAEPLRTNTHWSRTSPAAAAYRETYDEVQRLDRVLGDYLKAKGAKRLRSALQRSTAAGPGRRRRPVKGGASLARRAAAREGRAGRARKAHRFVCSAANL
ncbi:hypothetical protein [Caulobacter segnis]|uniref:hypothetical protein n=1 Tax=Caulobacter segnis TaxID=88688 RepID=UPI002856C4A0|nr:hypothetical protein [Caulobacter segnis]MDR6624817.1 hypothetical protein [Caulobacter segnis]